MNPQQHKQSITSVFNTVAGGYDRQALRLFPFCADRLVAHLQPAPGDKVLDVATGTGAAAVALAQAVGIDGRVIGIDLAEEMLAQAEQKARKLKLINVDLHVMDAESLEFRAGYFNHVTCAFGIFFLPHPDKALREWKRVMRPGGRVVFSTFGPNAFQPQSELFLDQIAAHGVPVPPQDAPFSARRFNEPEKCHRLLQDAGFSDIEVTVENLGYHLKDAEEWWEIVWNAGYRGLLMQLPPDRLSAFHAEHLAAIEKLGEAGLWLNVETIFAKGVC